MGRIGFVAMRSSHLVRGERNGCDDGMEDTR